jgi:hypothetical protein
MDALWTRNKRRVLRPNFRIHDHPEITNVKAFPAIWWKSVSLTNQGQLDSEFPPIGRPRTTTSRRRQLCEGVHLSMKLATGENTGEPGCKTIAIEGKFELD